MSSFIPSSVYHLQINEKMPLKKVISLLPYFNDLGIEGIYSSSIFEAASLHGYDIVNPNKINPLVGTAEEFDIFCQELQKINMKLILDVVPNHMGIKGKKNKWWLDVLENGPISAYADFFDIDFDPIKRELKNKILLPILGSTYGQTLLNQELKLIWEEDGLWISYHEYQLPINIESYQDIFTHKIETDLSQEAAKDHLECLTILKDLQKEPKNKQLHKQRLFDLSTRSEWFINRTKELLDLYNGKKGVHDSFDLLHELLEKQHYRLSSWLVAGQEINYRRFFNINELVAIHIEKESVLNAHHSLLFHFIEEGKIQGVRIDHPDGLYDPTEYFQRLQNYKPPLLVIEKILDLNEKLPENWQVQGTVGYEYLNILNGLFIKKSNESIVSKNYDKFIGKSTDFKELLYERKQKFILTHMGSETLTLGWRLSQISELNRDFRDFTRIDLTTALREIIACFPVYRTYIRKCEEVSKKDTDCIYEAIENAKTKNSDIDPSIFDYIRDIFLKPVKTPEELDFICRFQQQTAPVMAKGLEDSCFYIFNRMVSLNEVGGDPRHFGITKNEFHEFNFEKLQKWPLGFLPSSTQDTKWSEDARAKLNVLSEIPKKWFSIITTWEKENQKYKTKADGTFFPDQNTEYYLYQLMLAIWPDEGPSPEFFERLWNCFLKAMREAGLYTSWRHPNAPLEQAAKEFLTSILDPQSNTTFLPSFVLFQKEIAEKGRLNSLASLILKIGSCGIVDIYQGNESWQSSAMDPDNRRPIDFDFLSHDDSVKMQITKKALKCRKDNKDLFLKGDYITLQTHKDHKDNLIAFMRSYQDKTAIVATGRFFTELEEGWKQTYIAFPKRQAKTFKDIFTGKEIVLQKKERKLTLDASVVFTDYPFTILISQ